MSDVVKKRSWGRTRRREKVIVIGRKEIEETLQDLDKELGENKLISQRDGEKNESVLPVDMDLQQPELMSNERLVEALKRIKVPIPVYSDGRPSRERLLYLYKTNVLPQPQRNKQRWRKRRADGKEGVGEWEEWLCDKQGVNVDVSNGGDDWSTNGIGGSTVILKKKRKSPLVESEDKELLSATKRLLVALPSADVLSHSSTISQVPSSGAPPISLSSGISAVTSKPPAMSSGSGDSVQAVITITQPLICGTAALGVASGNLAGEPSGGAKANREKITWP